MNYVFYAKVWSLDLDNEITSDELFTIANNYAEAAAQIENSYSNCLISFNLYCFDSSVIYVDDIEDYLKEARNTFGKGDKQVTVRELITRLVRETNLDDTITVFDMDEKKFKDLAVEKLGKTIYLYVKEPKKSEMEILEDFFKNV